MAQTEFVVKESLLPLLSHLAGESPRPISPWARINPAGQLTPEDWTLLEEAGLCSAPQVLKREVAECIQLLLKANSYIRVRLIKGPIVVEHFIYGCGSEQKKLSISSSPKGFILSNPAPLEKILLGMVENWGDSAISSNALKLELEEEPALIFAAMVDLHRRELFRAWSALSKFEPCSYMLDDIRDSLNNGREDGQWLAYVFSKFAGWQDDIPAERLDEAMDALIHAKVLEKDEEETGRYRLAGEGLVFANNFLIISQIVKVEVGRELDDQKISRSEMLCVQAGMHDVICMEQFGNMLVIESVSNEYVCKLLDLFLSNSFNPQETESSFQLAEKEELPGAAPEGQASKYYMSREGKNYGPYALEELRSFKEQRLLLPEDLIWSETTEGWIKAGSLPDLFT